MSQQTLDDLVATEVAKAVEKHRKANRKLTAHVNATAAALAHMTLVASYAQHQRACCGSGDACSCGLAGAPHAADARTSTAIQAAAEVQGVVHAD